MLDRRRMLTTLAGASLAAALPAAARAQSAAPAGGSSRPIRIVVPYGAGSTTDLTARMIAPRMAQLLGTPVVVENKAGATGVIGSEEVARAAPDGHTLVMGTVASHGTLVSLRPLPYDVMKDFTCIGLATVPPGLVVVHPSVPANDLKSFAAWSRQQPKGVTYASSGVGGSGHLATELLRLKTDANLVHVPYKDVGKGIADLLAGHVQMMIYYAPVLPHVRSGKLKGLAVLSEKRVDFAPELPTALEQGVPGLVASGWAGLFGPAGMSNEVRDRLHAAMKAALLEPETRRKLADQGSEAMTLEPAEFRAFVKNEIDKWGEVVRVSGTKME
ncbi:MAG: Bug family tripartite tricarboxylate transporter substrate binding protein [Burkholderiaceae bacterium]